MDPVSHVTAGGVLTTIRTALALRTRWNLASWEARLRGEQSEIASQKAELEELIRRDAEFRANPESAVVVAVDQPVRLRWEGPETLTGQIVFNVRTIWIEPLTLEKLSSSVNSPYTGPFELPLYGDEVRIQPLSAVAISRTATWPLAAGRTWRANTPQPQGVVLQTLAVSARAYLVGRKAKFSVNGNLQVTALLEGW